MGIGSKVKLQMNYSSTLTEFPEVLSEEDPFGINFSSELIELEFNPVDP